ncbi:MATE family efflux transporter [Roseobacter sp. EG26]|uniref:MATE family efflux transporter n=1 Tax=Roseobacter sp. EG26 TaxID=3412477 RepID=UPI003CE5507A
MLHVSIRFTSNLRKSALSSQREMRDIVHLTIPIVIGLVAGLLMGIIDTMMVSPLGGSTLAAAGLATSAFIFVNSAVIGFVSVMGVKVAQAVGSDSKTSAGGAIAASMILTFCLASFSTVVMLISTPLISDLAPNRDILVLLESYWITLSFAAVPHVFLAAMRGFYSAIDRPWIGVLFTLLGVLLNIPLNWVFIHGWAGFDGMGLVGAGVASFLAKLAAVAALALHWKVARSMRSYRSLGRFRLATLSAQFKEAFPVAVGSVGEGGAYAVAGLLMSQLGTIAIAAHQIVHSVGVIFYMVPIGLMIAVSIRTGKAFGAHDMPRLRMIWASSTWLAFGWSLFVFLFVLVSRRTLSEGLAPSADVARLASLLFGAMALVHLADCFQSTALGILRGLSDNAIPNTISVVAYWMLAIPLAWGLGVHLGLGAFGVLTGYALGVLVTSIVLHHRVKRRTGMSANLTDARG